MQTALDRSRDRWLWVRLEGVLVHDEPLAAASWMALQGPRVSDRLRGLAHAAGAQWLRKDADLALRTAYAGLRGFSEDRLHLLGEEVAEQWRNRLATETVALVRSLRRDHDRVGLLSDALDVIVHPLLPHLPAFDCVLCQRMEVRQNAATGFLPGSLFRGPGAQSAVRNVMSEENAALENATFLGKAPWDLALLGAAGNAVIVTKNPSERRAATEAGWQLHP